MSSSSPHLRLVSKLVVMAEKNAHYNKFDTTLNNSSFQSDHLSSLGADFSVKNYVFMDQVNIEFQFWKIDPQTRGQPLTDRFLSNCKALILLPHSSQNHYLDKITALMIESEETKIIINQRSSSWIDFEHNPLQFLFSRVNLLHLFASDKQEEFRSKFKVRSISWDELNEDL